MAKNLHKKTKGNKMKFKREKAVFGLHILKIHILFLKLIILKTINTFKSKIFHSKFN